MTVEASKRNAHPLSERYLGLPLALRCAARSLVTARRTAHSSVEIGTVLGLSPSDAKPGYALWAQRGASV